MTADIVSLAEGIFGKFPPPISYMSEYCYYWLWINLNDPDYCLVSYPKSGRTWIRYLLANYFADKYGESIESRLYKMRNDDIPRIVATHDGKTVNLLTRSKKVYRDRQVLFLVRDPRDIVVSHYYHKTKRDEAFSGSLSKFIRNEYFGIRNVIQFMNEWSRRRGVPEDFMLVRYEDMKEDIYKETVRILEFLEEESIDNCALQMAIEEASFSRMKEKEKKGEIAISGLNKEVSGDAEMKVRKGKVGGYSDDMSEEDVRFVDRMVSETLDSYFGY